MANLNTQSFSALVSNFATAVQGSASQLIDFTIGSVLRAIAEATGGVALWLQGLILQVAALTRAATSSGADLDSFFAQFGFSRLPADAATTQETFSRFTPTSQALILVGDIVQTQDGSVQFAVVADTSNPAYSAAQNGYVLPAGQASVSVAVQCTVTGTVGNVASGALNTLGTAISGVDTVSNSVAVSNGSDAESDAAARSRFVLFIASLERATLAAVLNAIQSVQIGMTGIVAENQQYNGMAQNGYFTVIANDGSGSLNLTEKTNVENAVEAVRPLCSTYSVHAPTAQVITVSMTISVDSDHVKATAVPLVQAAVAAYISSIKTTSSGALLPYSAIATQAYSVDGVTNVTAVQVNGGTSDISITYQQAFQPGTITVN
ncbi:baseplate J/gp47 family protein [Paraburkholderia sp. BL17N1]|uniref:baseplate J/gp47 family protein n=1 Tax=Paraburkholderia sp. BL17N1 TaxID=1938798 RepID=UPI000EB03562|nr:baseplate J/gp47 family protein [Paraburkholderia sp. BL17N1]RKR46324.1 putative phage protein gp47/JayE [Paraburkholderia sp. BL17N1]